MLPRASSPPSTIQHDPETVPPHKKETATETPSQATSLVPHPDMVIDGYRLTKQLGQGGMGTVWEAVHEVSGRSVALKLLSSTQPINDEQADRFLREAKLAASLSHPRSTFVFGASNFGNSPYIVMELMPGTTLQHVVDDDGPMSIPEAIDHILDVIDGLQAAHALGVIHRDVKPSNCFLDGDGRVKVGDFGLSKSLVDEAHLTRTGAFLGTPLYSAPEQVRGEKVDERTDLYAVAATLFYLITGQGPFDGDAVSVIAQIAAEPPRKLRHLRDDAPKSLERIIDRALQKQPEKRFARLSDLRSALAPFGSKGSGIADIWRRCAAFLIDSVAFAIIVGMLSFIGNAVFAAYLFMSADRDRDPQLIADRINEMVPYLQVVELGLLIACFVLCESVWGRGFGKWMMGLKLVNHQGEVPRALAVLVRCAFVPGALGLRLISFFLIPFPQPGSQSAELNEGSLVLLSLLVSMLPNLFMILMFITVSRKNNYRAIHDLISGTRVVRIGDGLIKLAKHRLPAPAVTTSDFAGRRFGPFVAECQLAESPQCTILTASDSVLDRPVWIRLSNKASSDDSTRQPVSRPTRPFWLQSGYTGDNRWDAIEAVDGAPIGMALHSYQQHKWQRGSKWAYQLADELCQACHEGTVPNDLVMDHVWVDRHDQVKMLDTPIGPAAVLSAKKSGKPPEPPSGEVTESDDLPEESDVRRSMRLLQDVIHEATAGEIIPAASQDLISQLADKPPSIEGLEWARDQLQEISESPQVVTWETRTGSIAIALGIVGPIFITLGLTIGAVLSFAGALPAEIICLGVATLLYMLVVFDSVYFRGGLTFRALNFTVVTKRGLPPSTLRLAARAMVTWSIWICLAAGIAAVTGTQLGASEGSSSSPGLGGTEIFVCVVLFLLPLLLAASILACVFPRRGVQDYLCGTYLVPR